MCFWLWLTFASTPVEMIFPGQNVITGGGLLSVGELFWFLDVIRKLLLNSLKGEDTYTSAVRYIKSTLILDILALIP